MKTFQIVAGLVVGVSLLMPFGCSDTFSSRKDRIEASDVRPISMSVSSSNGTAEVAPGDTVTATSWFAGKPIDSLQWMASFSYFINSFGAEAAIDTDFLSTSKSTSVVPGSEIFVYDSISGMTKASISFVIPDTIVRVAMRREMPTLEGLPAGEKAKLPSFLLTKTPDEVIDFMLFASDTLFSADMDSLYSLYLLDLLDTSKHSIKWSDLPVDSQVLTRRISAFLDSSVSIPTPGVAVALISTVMEPLVASISRAFAAQVEVLQSGSDRFSGKYVFTVRYTSKLKNDRFAQPNRNPVITHIDIYREKTGKTFDVSKSSTYDTVFHMYGKWGSGKTDTVIVPDTVFVDLSRNYFIVATANKSDVDSGFSTNGGKGLEYYDYSWWYQNNVTSSQPEDSLLLIDQTGDSATSFLPPRDQSMTKFTVWCIVDDAYNGELFRPQGESMYEIKGVFKYK